MKKLSVTIITLNEEKDIKRCLDSVLPFADEIVVVDSLSTDRTKEICSSYTNLRFVQQKWLGYSEQKNYANDIATHDWIFSIDADEEVSTKLQQSILNGKTSRARTMNVSRWIGLQTTVENGLSVVVGTPIPKYVFGTEK
jgi:glycosyltransferase involved in cell wall biosynthesis